MAREVTSKKSNLPAEINFVDDANAGLTGLTSQDVAIPFFVLFQKTVYLKNYFTLFYLCIYSFSF